MGDCCVNPSELEIVNNGFCPSCKSKSRNIKVITLKSLLKPSALETLNGQITHYFCSSKDCDVVYFDINNKKYHVTEIKVAVYQKEDSSTTPICYCFDWTKEKIEKYINQELTPKPIEHIRENVKEYRCGCEVNNPQGSCCLGNVTKYIKSLS